MRKRYVPAGDVITDIADVGLAAGYIASDPALPALAREIQVLHELEAGEPSSGGKGIGLGRVLPAVKLYVEYRRNPIVMGTLVLGALVGVPFLLGYLAGRR